jgi:hypothetical protein
VNYYTDEAFPVACRLQKEQYHSKNVKEMKTGRIITRTLLISLPFPLDGGVIKRISS